MTPSRFFLIFTIIFSLGVSAVSAETIREKELKRIELNKKYDKLKLRERNDFVTDCSKNFLVEPEEKAAAGKFSVAKVPPTVNMRIIPGSEKLGYSAHREYAPLVQYDVKTGRKKALCWLHDYYFEKFGYWIGSSYGMEISKDGKFIVICMNGAFQGWNESYGHPSLFVIEIPEEEREE